MLRAVIHHLLPEPHLCDAFLECSPGEIGCGEDVRISVVFQEQTGNVPRRNGSIAKLLHAWTIESHHPKGCVGERVGRCAMIPQQRFNPGGLSPNAGQHACHVVRRCGVPKCAVVREGEELFVGHSVSLRGSSKQGCDLHTSTRQSCPSLKSSGTLPAKNESRALA